MKLLSLFSGAGGLDLGFKKANYNIIWANEFDKSIWDTYRANHKETFLDTRTIEDIDILDVPDCDGIIGGPPCQSWSEAGSQRGFNDERGKLFLEFIRILKAKKPKFFLAENVSGMLAPKHTKALKNIKQMFIKCGYDLHFQQINAYDYGIPQDRKRVLFVGFRKDLKIKNFKFPKIVEQKLTLKDALNNLDEQLAVPALEKNYHNPNTKILNHEYMIGGFSSIYLSRNRVRSYDEPSFTIQAGGRHAPIHPRAPKMNNIGKDKFEFYKGKEDLYRRLTIRECARVQTFPDNFEFIYNKVSDGYKMVGNAVPVNLAYILAKNIDNYLR